MAFPTEIWCCIVDAIPNAETWFSFSLACRYFYAITSDPLTLSKARLRLAIETTYTAPFPAGLPFYPQSLEADRMVVRRLRNGVWHGDCLCYQASRLLERIEYRDGKKQGRYLRYSERSGELEAMCHYSAGLYDGAFIRYYWNGQPSVISHYRKGLNHGEETTWDSRGRKIEVSNWKQGVRHGYNCLWSNGVKVLEYNAVDGDIDGPATRYHNNGTIRSITHYKAGKMHGQQIIYDQSGAAVRSTWFAYDYEVGPRS